MGNVVEGIYDQIIKDIEDYKEFQKEQEEFDMEQLIIQLVEDITKDEQEYKERVNQEKLNEVNERIGMIRAAYQRGKSDGLKLAAKSFATGVGIGLVGLSIAAKVVNK